MEYVKITNEDLGEVYVPKKVFETALSEVTQVTDKINELPRALRGLMKKAVKKVDGDTLAKETIANVILTVRKLGGTIEWNETE